MLGKQEERAEEETEAAARAPAANGATALSVAGVRRELAHSLAGSRNEDREEEEAEEGEGEGERGQDLALLLLAWAVLLATLLGHAPLSPARKRLSQALLDMDR